MHELSIAVGILDIACRQAREAGARIIHRVEVEVGALAGVEPEALAFCFDTAREGPAAGAELVIHHIPGRGRCPACRRDVPVDFFVAVCPECGRTGVDITAGKELKVRSLSVD